MTGRSVAGRMAPSTRSSGCEPIVRIRSVPFLSMTARRAASNEFVTTRATIIGAVPIGSMSSVPCRWKKVHLFRPVSAAAFVVAVDQLAKAGAAHATTPAHNPDLAFGVAHGPPTVLVALSILVLGAFLAVVGRLAVHAGISPVLPALIAGGMLGNVLDRARFGTVRDFIPTPFAIINVADIAVMVGVVLLGLGLTLRLRHLPVQ